MKPIKRRKPASERRPARISVQLSLVENRKLEAHAKKEGRSVASAARRLILESLR